MVAIEKFFGGPTTSLQLLKKKAEKKKRSTTGGHLMLHWINYLLRRTFAKFKRLLACRLKKKS